MEIWDLHCHLSGVPGRTPEERLYANQPFGKGEWLGQVVVCPGLKIAYFVGNRVACGEDQDWHLSILGSNPSKNFAAIQLRKHQIEDHQIVVVGRGKIQSGLAIRRNVDGESLFRQSASDEAGYLLLVFDQ